MYGKSIPQPQKGVSPSAASGMRSGRTCPNGAKEWSVAKASNPGQSTSPWLPPSSPMAGFASRLLARSAGWPRFPKPGTEPTILRSSSGAVWPSPSRAGPQARSAERAERRSGTSRRGRRGRSRPRSHRDSSRPEASGPFFRQPRGCCKSRRWSCACPGRRASYTGSTSTLSQ